MAPATHLAGPSGGYAAGAVAAPNISVAQPVAQGKAEPSEQDALLLEHLPAVRYIARRIHEQLPQHVEMEDLVSAGVLGLIDASRKFDRTRQVQFTTYAKFRIRGAILDSLRELDWGSREQRRRGRAIGEAVEELLGELGRTPNEQEVADRLECSLEEYQQMLGELNSLQIGALNVERHEDSGEEELAYVAGPEEDNPLFQCLRGEMRQRLADAIEQLGERERLVLTLSYYEELTLREIGTVLSVSEARVSQIRSAAVLALRALLSRSEMQKKPAKQEARDLGNRKELSRG